jgi:UDP-MurNAc hydroxylase
MLGNNMKRNVLTFINHACFTVHNESALLLVDPWLEGPALNNGWSLLDQSTSNTGMLVQLERSRLPVYIWYSNEHSDHFSVSFVKKLKENFRGKVTFLFRHTLDKRLHGFLRHNEFNVIECAAGVPVALGHDMRITVFPHGDSGSWCLINCGGRTILNLNDCVLASAEDCRAVRRQAERVSPRIDFLFTQFGYANWVGNPDQSALRKSAAHEQVNRIARQIAHLKPRVVVPFASFVYFSHPENAYHNAEQNTPQAIVKAAQLATVAHMIRFMQPGGTIDLDDDGAASLAAASERAVAHWMALEGRGALLPVQGPAPLGEVKAAFERYREAVTTGLLGLPGLLEWTGRIKPLSINLMDVHQTVQVSYRGGLKVLDRSAPAHISIASSNVIFLFKNEDGCDTTHANGRFRAASPAALMLFTRFFLPQRMLKNGYDKGRPLMTMAYLARNVATSLTRQLQGLLRRFSSSA